MAEENQRILQLFLALILVALLLIAVVIVLQNPSFGKVQTTTSGNTISNSYNNYNYTTNTVNVPQTKTYQNVVYNRDYVVYKKTNDNYVNSNTNTLGDYSSYGNHERTKDFVGSYVDDFYVYVKNNQYEGNYFTVKFYLKDSSGHEDVETVTKYISGKDQVRFLYRDIQFDRYKYSSWRYEVLLG